MTGPMRTNALRKELINITAAFGLARFPALRRSLREEWLYAADLPGFCAPDSLAQIRKKLAEAGWETREEQGWLQLRKAAPEPPEGWFEGPFGPEASCCLSLLSRHKGTAEDGLTQRLLIKAGEEGAEAYETVCLRLHREWAARLRDGKKLPAVSLRYFK